MSDLISRQEAIDAIEKNTYRHTYLDQIVDIINALPSAQPEIIRCKECKHRPTATKADEEIFYGFSVEFPDNKCPCFCEDGWYGWYPKDDFYCGYAERREE